MADPEPDCPRLFLDIPAAASSLAATLAPAYGEAAIRRVGRSDRDLPALAMAPGPTALLHGAVPLHLWGDPARQDWPGPGLFTLLRHPVARVQALFRGLSADPPERLAQWGLQPGFTVADLMATRSRGAVEHVANGMCRLLCGDPAFSTPTGGAAFDDPASHPGLLTAALDTLRRICFGLAEDLPASLRLLQHGWGIPYALHAPDAPAVSPGPEHDPQAIRAIVERNTLDIALYEAARDLFQARCAAPSPPSQQDQRAIWAAPAGRWVDIAGVAGRQGFHPPDPHGVAWLDAEAETRLHLLVPPQATRISLRLLCVGERYPVQRIRLRLDGQDLSCAVTARDGRWATLQTEPLHSGAGLHALTIAPPYAVPLRALIPGTQDRRRMSVGIAKLLLGA